MIFVILQTFDILLGASQLYDWLVYQFSISVTAKIQNFDFVEAYVPK